MTTIHLVDPTQYLLLTKIFSMNRYKYQPLQYHDSIRILLLQPSSDASAPITCTIQHVRLSDPGLSWFEAISYTWGTIAEKTIYIQDEKAELRVRENCHSALQHLRRRDTIRPLWIDAVCIDQENLGERASQVRIMNEIYSGALTVVVYLGEQDEGSVALFEELEAADQLLQQLKKCERPPPSDALLREIDRLYQRPWFNRVWVLQEVSGKACVDIMCGSTTVSMEALVAFNFGYRRGYSVTKTDWPQVLEWNHRPPRDFSTPQFDLWNRLYHSRRCVATDPRDRVFALRSLMGSKRSELDSLIDYTKSLEQCFIDVAKFLLPVLGLRILVAVRHPHTKSMPSWIPDWSQSLPLQHNFFWTEADLFCADQAEPNYRPSYQPLDETKLTIRSFVGKDQKEGLELRVTGCRYAQIVARSQVFSFDSADEAEEQIKSLYSSLSNLRAFIGLDNMIIDNEISEKLGQDIIKGK